MNSFICLEGPLQAAARHEEAGSRVLVGRDKGGFCTQQTGTVQDTLIYMGIVFQEFRN